MPVFAVRVPEKDGDVSRFLRKENEDAKGLLEDDICRAVSDSEAIVSIDDVVILKGEVRSARRES